MIRVNRRVTEKNTTVRTHSLFHLRAVIYLQLIDLCSTRKAEVGGGQSSELENVIHAVEALNSAKPHIHMTIT